MEEQLKQWDWLHIGEQQVMYSICTVYHEDMLGCRWKQWSLSTGSHHQIVTNRSRRD